MKKFIFPIIFIILIVVGFLIWKASVVRPASVSSKPEEKKQQVFGTPTTTIEEWKKLLTPEQFYILKESGTEAPFSHMEMVNNHEKGTYVSADCGEPVFRSEQKFESGTGWPSFWAPINSDAIVVKTDTSFGIERTEVLGKKCGGHLGHVFDDGPEPTGKRYCINAAALVFIPDSK